ncbi:hypothetical protein [Anaplasma marginale]|uniref:Uncharacterized protein n=1 Tax=Anaplasma marginale (strain Florida) TaxID=320483 RepID=B9KI74_ANAMF|nr:hypothetical protein [Anaplasma marginale]ACM49186.1 Hypothetical protein AMF_315 [Anaplasma marginale str. Florida]
MRALMDAEGIVAACTAVTNEVDKAVEEAVSAEIAKLVAQQANQVDSMEALQNLASSKEGQAAIQKAQDAFLNGTARPEIRRAFGDTKAGVLSGYIDSELPHGDNESRFNLELAMYKLTKLKTPTEYVNSLDSEDFRKLVAFVDVASNLANTLSESDLREEQSKREAQYAKQKASTMESVAEKMKMITGGDGDMKAVAKSALEFIQNMIRTKKPPRSSDVMCPEFLGSVTSAIAIVCLLCIVGSGGMVATIFPIQAALAVVGAMRTVTADDRATTASIHNPLGGHVAARMFSRDEPRQQTWAKPREDETFALREERKKSEVEVNQDLRHRSS